MAYALHTTAEVKADLTRRLRDAGRMTANDPAYEWVHGELDRLCEELVMLERMP